MAKLFLAFARTGLITGAVILLFVLSAPLLRKKYTARLRRAVWLLLAVLLLFPFSLFPTVLLPGREAPLQIELPVAAAEAVLARQQPDSSAANSGWQRDAAGQAAALPANDPVPAARPAAQPAAVAQPTDLSPLLPQKPTPPTPAPLSPLGIASFVWLGGALMLLLGQLLHYALWRRRLRRWDQPLSPQLAQAVDRAAQVVRLRRPPPAFANNRVRTPMLVGALRPVLLVPPRLEQDPGLLLMLRHELIHALHRDLAWKGLLLAVRALHWYHPAVWLLCREAEQDMEYACDEAVLRGSGPAVRAAYGGALLSVAGVGAHATALATPFSAGGRAMKRRLEALFRQDGKRRGGALFACALLLTGIFGGLVGCGIAGETPALASPMPSAPAQAEAGLSLSFHASTEQGIFQMTYSLEKPYLEDCQLTYTDFTTGVTKPLCPNPDCDHCGPGCASFFYAQIGNFHMGIISDQLVLVYNVHQPQDPALLSSGEFFPPTIRVETMALDGSGRRVLATLRPVEAEPETGYVSTHLSYVLSDGAFLYLFAASPVSNPNRPYALLRVDLSDGTSTLLQGFSTFCAGTYPGHLLFGGFDVAAGELRFDAVPLSGGEPRQVYCGYYGQDSGYLLDGQNLYLTNSAEHSLKKYDFTTGEEVLITDQLPPLPDSVVPQSYYPEQLVGQKLLLSAFLYTAAEVKHWAVDVVTGAVQEITFLPPEQSDQASFWPSCILAETEDQLCFSVPNEDDPFSHLVLADKEAFWRGELKLRHLESFP